MLFFVVVLVSLSPAPHSIHQFSAMGDGSSTKPASCSTSSTVIVNNVMT